MKAIAVGGLTRDSLEDLLPLFGYACFGPERFSENTLCNTRGGLFAAPFLS